MDIDQYLAQKDNPEYKEPETDDYSSLLIDADDEPEVEAEPEAKPEQETASESKESTEPEAEPEAEKKKQSAEENAKFAEQRRQKQLEDRLQQEREKDPAYILAKRLTETTGKTPEQMLQELEAVALQEQAKVQQVPVEVLQAQQKQQRDIDLLKEENHKLKFTGWFDRTEKEIETLKATYPMLTDDELHEAQSYVLKTLKDPEMPIQNAVHALYGDKIIKSIQEQSRNDALAALSGRTSAPAPAATKSSSSAVILTADEQEAAKIFGMTEEEYAKWKPKK